MAYRIDVWSGETHMQHAFRKECETWEEAADCMAPLIDEGLLCNVLSTDFNASEDRVETT
ncbi:hypothetical protein ACQU0X_30795 [Pseudovibrio ascidiaceicola]|uniref:hypothetical protein n=1 Tax=Pseudovibrio ascidiaceicola TaxID=285279 RepID=UPI003D35E5D5